MYENWVFPNTMSEELGYTYSLNCSDSDSPIHDYECRVNTADGKHTFDLHGFDLRGRDQVSGDREGLVTGVHADQYSDDGNINIGFEGGVECKVQRGGHEGDVLFCAHEDTQTNFSY